MYVKLRQKIIFFISLFLLASCTVRPDPVTDLERWKQAQKDLRKLYAGQEEVTGPISLYEAFARALKYNYDYRVKLYEKALAMKQYSVSRYEMLPDLVATLGYHNRNEFGGGFTRNIFTGAVNVNSATASQERDRRTGELELTWSILDFGVSYYTARQRGRDIYRGFEQQRKTFQNIYKEVVSAYWRAVSADRLIKDIKRLKKQVNKALYRARQVEDNRLDEPLKVLGYQRNLLEVIRNLNTLLRNLKPAKVELATLMGLPLDVDYELVDTKRKRYKVQEFDIPMDWLQAIALINRPELRDLDYQYRNGADEIYKAYLQLLPNFTINTNEQYDTNVFTLNNQFRTLVAESTLNIFNILSGPETFDVLEAQGKVLEAQRLALSAAVITQVNLSYARYEMAKEDYDLAMKTKRVSSRIFQQVKNREVTDADDEQQLILAAANDIIGRTQLMVAYAELQNAFIAIADSVGRDIVPYLPSRKLPVAKLSKLIEAHVNLWDDKATYEKLYQELTKMKAVHTKMNVETNNKPQQKRKRKRKYIRF